jgi:hypothetical protein
MFAAAIESDKAQYRERFLPPSQRSRERLLESLTPEFADAVLSFYGQSDTRNRRFEKGSVEEQTTLRMENYLPTPQGGDVILCRRNNASEFDTKGTADQTDDTLVQDTLAISGWRVRIIRDSGKWKRAWAKREDAEKCINVFS